MDSKAKAKDTYLARELEKPGVTKEDENVRENLRVMDCCATWDLDQRLSKDEILNLVTVICSESKARIRNNHRLLRDGAAEANQQLFSEGRSGEIKSG